MHALGEWLRWCIAGFALAAQSYYFGCEETRILPADVSRNSMAESGQLTVGERR
ncbi:hypothetical protein [Gloeobacter kilaueensis]|uniref:Uncharacterized protein n=1 Tax=Gloeobacter kilaueensis (strain ATCC BAA-2537 / CCAP 1431/1 / ULC 316 / JS1) TaxID=1183438 RepID=U5QNE1_GLOK1|nr:hypothetical protein [Gloeobacter kilaueensis]AGY59124.1 hypothetical protein GKIL_2878 [Gloeobacter kilaueensis JS1]